MRLFCAQCARGIEEARGLGRTLDGRGEVLVAPAAVDDAAAVDSDQDGSAVALDGEVDLVARRGRVVAVRRHLEQAGEKCDWRRPQSQMRTRDRGAPSTLAPFRPGGSLASYLTRQEDFVL
jgi:hypothetical protein